MDEPKVTKKARYIELDSLRGLAALVVFFSHALGMINLIDRPYGNLLTNSFLHFFWDGAAAVVLFFVLSGFVLALPYVGEKRRSMDFVPFYIRRVLRIYPAYYAALAFSLILKFYVFKIGSLEGLSEFATQFWWWENSMLDWKSVVKHLLMVGPQYDMGQIDPIIWSLVVEMKISLIYPFVILILTRIKNLSGAALFLLLTIELYRFTKIDLLSYLPLFVMGGLMAVYKERIIDFVSKLSLWKLSVFAIVGLALYTSRYSLRISFINYTYTNYLIGAGVCMIIAISISIYKVKSILSLKPFKYLGDISYSLYLLHFPIILAVTSLIYPRTGSIKIPWIVSLAITLMLPYLNYRLVEVPFMNMGKKLSKKANEVIVRVSKKYMPKDQKTKEFGG